jgi:hypothetical protein
MAKHHKQPHKSKQTTSQEQPEQSASVRTRTAITTKPLPPLEMDDGNAPTDKLSPISGAIRRRQLFIGGAGLAATALALGGWFWTSAPHPSSPPQPASSPTPSDRSGDQLVVYWNNAAFQVLRNQQSPLPIAARALSIIHTSMFDAWAAYDSTAVGSRLGASLRQPGDEQTLENKCRAISYAAYRALAGLFPGAQNHLGRLMTSLGYDPSARGTGASTAAKIGTRAAQAVLDFRQNDGANQAGAYADYTHYQPVNAPQDLLSPDYWQPLSLPEGHAGSHLQEFICAQWGNVTPFALASALPLVPRPGPPLSTDSQYSNQAQQMLQYSANLNDTQKVIAEYWSTSPEEQLLARWFAFARFISERDNHSLDQNVKLFFSLANAVLDTSIACWACKRTYSSAYPVMVIRSLFKGRQIRAWGGPGKDQQWMDGQYWLPYSSSKTLTPAYPEYCSEQSAFSTACATILRNFTGRDELGTSVTVPAHSSTIEPLVPAGPITLSWRTFSQAANEAGMAGRYSGLHFPQSDLDGRLLGSRVAAQVWLKAQSYMYGQSGI